MRIKRVRVEKIRGVYTMLLSGFIAYSPMVMLFNGEYQEIGTIYAGQEQTVMGVTIHLLLTIVMFFLCLDAYEGICKRHATLLGIEFTNKKKQGQKYNKITQ